MIYALAYILIGLCLSYFADRLLSGHNEPTLGFLATALFIFAWPIALCLVIFFIIQAARGK